MTTEKGKTKIRWTESEKLVVLREAIRLRWSSPYMNWTPALKVAQKLLPANRRRPEASLENAASGLLKEADVLRTNRTHIAPESHDYSASEVPSSEIPASEVPVEEVVQHAVEALAPSDPMQAAIEALAQQACNMILPAFKELLKAKLREGMLGAVQEISPEELVVELIKEKPQERKRKLKVVIVGMIGQQISLLRHEYGETFDLSFHEASESNKLIKGRVANADYVLINTTKIDHSIYHTIKAHTKNHVSVPGDTSSMRRKLDLIKQDNNLV